MPRLPLLTALAGLLLYPPAHAATVTATVADNSGRPLPGAVVVLEPVGTRLAVKPMGGVEIAQAKRTFIPDVTVVTVGTPVTFPNRDTVRHHVYSFSPAKTFELKLYSGTPSTPVVFDKPGVVVLGCNIHDQMSAWVVVVDTPYQGRSGEQGQARLDGVAPGVYRLLAWHPRLAPDAALPSVGVTVGGSDVEVPIRVGTTPAAP
jgi:plastocyanin